MRNLDCLFAGLVVLAGCSQQPVPTDQSTGAAIVEGSEMSASADVSEAASTTAAETAESPDAGAADSDDAMTLYRRAQALMTAGEFGEGHDTARKAMQQFIAEDNDLPWLLLETIEVGDQHIEVHLNMGERERRMPDDGIVRPLSFRIWSAGADPNLPLILDYEIARFDGKSLTAAIGETSETGHANYGMMKVDDSYETIRQRVIDLVSRK